jgi:hypothetical protein
MTSFIALLCCPSASKGAVQKRGDWRRHWHGGILTLDSGTFDAREGNRSG